MPLLWYCEFMPRILISSGSGGLRVAGLRRCSVRRSVFPCRPFHGKRKRVCAILSTGVCRSALRQVAPPSVVISTLAIAPRPLPRDAGQFVGFSGGERVAAGRPRDQRLGFELEGELPRRAVGHQSVYFEVSSRLIAGWFITLRRAATSTLALPSQPGRSRRSG